MREKKNIITLEIGSALALMQEIYNDIVEQRNTASLITKKMLTFMKDAEDMSIIGPTIKDQQRIMNDCTEKKISLVKLQGVLLKQSGGGSKDGFTKMTFTDEDNLLLERLMKDNGDDDKNLKSGEYS